MKVCTKCNRESSSGRLKKSLCHSCYNTQWEKKSEKSKEYKAEFYKNHRKAIIERANAWSKKNRERRREISANWTKNNPQKHCANQKKRREQIRLRTPKWADLNKIKYFYEHRPDGMTVDHIIPLIGKNVSGLHVPENLQYLTMEQNIKKSNSFGGAL